MSAKPIHAREAHPGSYNIRQRSRDSLNQDHPVRNRRESHHHDHGDEHGHHDEPNQFLIFMALNLAVGAFIYLVYRFMGTGYK